MTIVAHKIESRSQWKRLRAGHITASRAACLLGVDAYSTPFQYYHELAGNAPDIEETPPMRRGRLLEPVAVAMLREDFPTWKFWEPATYLADTDAMIGATPDLYGRPPQMVTGFVNVQIKSIEPSIFRKNWQVENEGAEAPLQYAVQTIIEAHLSGASQAYVAPLRVGFGVEIDLLEVPIMQNVIEAVYDAAADMHARVRAGREPPADYRRDADLLASLYAAREGETIDLSGDNRIHELLAEHRLRSAELKAAKEKRDTCRAEIMHKLGEAVVATIGEDARITFKRVFKKGHSVAATSYRALRITDKRERTNANDAD